MSAYLGSPQAASDLCQFVVGRDSCGRWVAQDTLHRRGGLFVSRAAAIKYAMSECDHCADMIFCTNSPVELDFPERRRSLKLCSSAGPRD